MWKLPHTIAVGETWLLDLENHDACSVSRSTKSLQFLSENPNIIPIDFT